MAVVNSDCKRSRHQFNTLKKRTPLRPSRISLQTPLQQVPNLFSTPSRRITHTEKAGYWLHHWNGGKKRHSRIAEFSCLFKRLFRADVFEQRQADKAVHTASLTMKRMRPPLLLVIFDSPLNPSQHLHRLHLNFSLSSSRHATCMHVFFSTEPPIMTCLLLLSLRTVLFSCFQCRINSPCVLFSICCFLSDTAVTTEERRQQKI